MVWSYLDNDADRICLALTCKLHAATFDHMHVHRPNHEVITKEHRLAVLVRLVTWRGLAMYRLCYSCVSYRRPGRGWSGDDDMVKKGWVTPEAIIRGPRCPSCTIRKKLEILKITPELTNYNRNVTRILF